MSDVGYRDNARSEASQLADFPIAEVSAWARFVCRDASWPSHARVSARVLRDYTYKLGEAVSEEGER